jgi:hypothetical protein
MMYIAVDEVSNPANASAAFVWTFDKKSEFLNSSQHTCKEQTETANVRRRMSLRVNDALTPSIVATDSLCQPLQVVNISKRQSDFVFFGRTDGKPASYEWIGLRKFVNVEPTVHVGGVQQNVNEFVCGLASTDPISERALVLNAPTESNLTIYQSGVSSKTSWGESNTYARVTRHEDVTLTSISPVSGFVEGGWLTTIGISRNVLLGTLSVAVAGPSNETLFFRECATASPDKTVKCKTPSFGASRGAPPTVPTMSTLFWSVNEGLQFSKSNIKIQFVPHDSCPVVSRTSFEDSIVEIQGMIASGFAKKDAHCGDATETGTKSLQFRSIDPGQRSLETAEFDARCGAEIKFAIRIGQYDDCKLHNSVGSQAVRFQFSTDKGFHWYDLENYFGATSPTVWTLVSMRVPKEAMTERVKFRWLSDPALDEVLASQAIAWALDDIEVTASQCSSTVQLVFAGRLEPNCGPTGGNTKVTVFGDFAKAVGVNVICMFGQNAGFVDAVTSSAVTCTSPPSVTGFVNVSVSICGSAETVSTTKFFYYEPPQIQKYQPTSMPTTGGLVRFILEDGYAAFDAPFAKAKYSNCKKGSDDAPCSALLQPIEFEAGAQFLSEDELLSSQPSGSSYQEAGFPFSGSVEDLRFQSVYTWDQLVASGLRAGDVVQTLKVLPAECPTSGIVAQGFRVSSLMRDGDPSDGWLPIGFTDGLYMSTQSASDIPQTVYGGSGGATVLSTDCIRGSDGKLQWIDLPLDVPIVIAQEKSLILEFSEENDGNFVAPTGNNLIFGLTMRHLFTSHTVRWSGSDAGAWPFFASEFSFADDKILDQRVPALKMCTNEGCPEIQTVTSTMPDLSEVPTDITQAKFYVGIALNGQQYDYFDFTLFDAMRNLLEVKPPLGPMKGGTSIRIKPGDYVSGESSPVAVFKSSGSAQSNTRRLSGTVISEEIGVPKYFTQCVKILVNAQPFFDCASTPPAPLGNYNVFLSLNSVSFDAEGVQYYFYPPMSVTSIAPFRGPAFGGDTITVTGTGFLTLLPAVDLVFCRFGRSCLTGDEDCVGDVIQTPYTIDVEEGVEIRSKAKFIDDNTIECPAPARPLGDWEIFVSNNGQDWEPSEDSGVTFSLYTSRPCGSGFEATEYYDQCTVCQPGFFDEDPERPNLEGKLTDEVYPIQCAQCPIGQYQEDTGQLQCLQCPQGTTTLATLGNRIVQIAAASSRQNDCTCINKELSADGEASFYQDTTSAATIDPTICTWDNGGCCSPCPEGAVCNGGNETIFADDGYWQSITPAGIVLEVFQKCTPASACKRCDLECMQEKKACADKTVAQGGLSLLNRTHPICQIECLCDNVRCYEGEACSVCGRAINVPDGTIRQNFYREDGFCERCPPTDGAMLALMVVAAMIGLYFFALFAQYFRGLGAPRIFTNFMAVTVAFANFDLNWPPEIIAFFRWFSQFYIDIDVVKPECELVLTFFQKWMYTMIIPIFVLTVLFSWYMFTQLAMKPFGSPKEKERTKDKDRRIVWITFNERGKAWALIQSLRLRNSQIEVYDGLDGVTWYLDPRETAVFSGADRKSIRMWKRGIEDDSGNLGNEKISTTKAKLHVIRFDLRNTSIGLERLAAVESCRVTAVDVIKKPLYDPILHVPNSLLVKSDSEPVPVPKTTGEGMSVARKPATAVTFKAPVFRVTRRVRSRAVKIAGIPFNSSTVASHGKLLASIGPAGKVEFSRGFACLFKLDKDVASRRKEFLIDKIKLDVDGPVSTSTCKATLRLRVTILRSRHGEPDWEGEPLADGSVKIAAPGVVAVDFSGAAAISHYWHPTYWLVVKPTAAHLVGHDAKAGHWVLRHAHNAAYPGTQLMTSTMGAGAVDAIDMGAYTRTSFVPLQKGIRIQGISAWGDWKHIRCATCEAKHQKNRDDPDKWDEVVTCEHETAFAFGITCVYPDDMDYVAAGDTAKQVKKALRNQRRERSIVDLNDQSSEAAYSDADTRDIEENDATGYDSLEESDSDSNKSADDTPAADEGGKDSRGAESKLRSSSGAGLDFVPRMSAEMRALELEKVHGLARLESDMGELGILLAQSTIHLGYRNKTSVFMQAVRKRKMTCSTDCKNCGSRCKQNRCGRALAEPFVFLWTFVGLIWYSVLLVFWTAFLAVGMVLWVIITFLRSIWAACHLSFMAKEMTYLKFHSRCCCCCGHWRVSLSSLILLIVLGIYWIFLGDLALQWGLDLAEGSPGVLWFPYSRMHFLSLLFVLLALCLVIIMRPRHLFDLEKIRSAGHQNVLFRADMKQGQDTARGLVIMKMGPALLIESRHDSDRAKRKPILSVIHERQVLETGLIDTSNTSSSGALEALTSSLGHKSDRPAGGTLENAELNHGKLVKTVFNTTSGKFSVDLNTSAASRWAEWTKEREHAGVQDNDMFSIIEGTLSHHYANEGWKDEYFTLLVDESSKGSSSKGSSSKGSGSAQFRWARNKNDPALIGVVALDQSSTFLRGKSSTVTSSEVGKVSAYSDAKVAASLLYDVADDAIDDVEIDNNIDEKNYTVNDREKFQFEICVMNGSRTITLSAPSEGIRDEWMSALLRVVPGGSKRSSRLEDAEVFDDRTADVENVHVRDLTHWTWYDAAFGPHLLRYVLTTHSLNEFDAQRNSIYQVQEMHKVHELQGIDKVVEWDIKNSYINAYFIFIMYVHLTLTKTITGVFICTEQPHSGDLTLDEHPEMICWSSSEHQRVVAWAQFFLLVYALGLPLFIVYKLREIFRSEREFDPSMRARYGYLYFKYTTEAYLWEIVILGRKVFIAIVRMFTKTAAYFLVQSSGALIVLAILLVMHILWQPYNEPFLNNMESAALTNHVFVLFIGIMFQSGALGEGDDSILSPFTFALFVMASIMVTFFYLVLGMVKELKEMGIINMAAQGASAIVLENYGRSVQKLRRTARSHWCFRPLGNCCNKSHGERGRMDEHDDEHDETMSRMRKKNKAATDSDEDGDVAKGESSSKKTGEAGDDKKGQMNETERKEKKESFTKQNRKKKEHYPPPPPRYAPPSLHYDDWTCPSCNFVNLGKVHPYANTCAQCEKRRPRRKAKLRVTLAQKKRALGLEIDILSSVLLSEDAQFAAVNWGIEDHSTTLRETYWLVKALQELTFSIMEVFFNIRQISKQQEMQQNYLGLWKEMQSFLAPFKHIWNSCCARKVQAKIDKKLESRGWARRKDPLSKASYYVHIDRQGDMAASKATVSEPGWYAYFDCDLLRMYYAYLGENSWEHVTWKRPHEQGAIVNGSIGEIITAVSWKRPKIPDVFVKVKIDRLVDRLQEFDDLMGKVKTLVGPSVHLPEFLSFKEYMAGLLGVPIHGLVATHRNKKEASHEDRATRHVSRLMLTTPSVPLELDDGERPLASIELVENESSSDDQNTENSSSDTSTSEEDEPQQDYKAVRITKEKEEAEKVVDAELNKAIVSTEEFQVENFDYAALFDGLDSKSEPPRLKPAILAPKTARALNLTRKSTMSLLLGGVRETRVSEISSATDLAADGTNSKEAPAVLEKSAEKFSEKSSEKSSEKPAIGDPDKKRDQRTEETTHSLARQSTMAVLLGGDEKPVGMPVVTKDSVKAATPPPSSLDTFTPQQSKHIAENIERWKSEFNANSKIPKSMKAFFKKEKMPKKYAKSLLSEEMTVPSIAEDDTMARVKMGVSDAVAEASSIVASSIAGKEEKKLAPQPKETDGKASPFTAEQQKYIEDHLEEWHASFGQTKKIPKKMKAYFKRERLKKGYANTLLGIGKAKVNDLS